MNIVDFIDLQNKEHRDAVKTLVKYGWWPEEFSGKYDLHNEKFQFGPTWYLDLLQKIVDETFLKE